MHDFSPDRTAIRLKPSALRAVSHGHPWVFADGILRQNSNGKMGDLAVLFDRQRAFVGLGLYDPDSPIRVRVLHHGPQEVIDTAWLRARLQEAFKVRSSLFEDPQTDGFRLLHGENDGLPGIVIDQYNETLVLRLDTAAWVPHLPPLVDVLNDLLSPARIVLRLSRNAKRSHGLAKDVADGALLLGSRSTEVLTFLENGLRFEVDPVAGQKTGFFLDQRDNRQRVGGLSSGCDVLNVFAYTGGFSLYAARGGARRVVSLDISGPALAAAERNFELNRHIENVARAHHETLRADAFKALESMARRSETFDVVILDPPSLAHKTEDVRKAVNAYEKLVRSGAQVITRNGILVAASCSARVTKDAFFKAVQRGVSLAGRCLMIMERTGHALDHPIGFPEGAYLKCIFGRVL